MLRLGNIKRQVAPSLNRKALLQRICCHVVHSVWGNQQIYMQRRPVPQKPKSSAAEAPPQKCLLGAAPNGDSWKNVFDVMLHLEAEWPSNKISYLQTQFWQKQARSQVSIFWGKKFYGEIFLSLSYVEKIFFEHNKIWGNNKDLGDDCPRIPPAFAGLGRTFPRKSSIVGLHVCEGA